MSESNLFMERPLSIPIPLIEIPEEYSVICVNEENGHLWERIMTKAFMEEYKPGTFKDIMAGNYYYDEDRVFVMLNERGEPIATATSWQNDHWWNDTMHGSIIFVGVDPVYRGHRYGLLMVNYVLQDMVKRGLAIASLDVAHNNLSAIKTYINCGFTPHIIEAEHIEEWKNHFQQLSLPVPNYDNSLRPLNDKPYPEQISPYRERMAKAAMENGNMYVHGNWEAHHMYLVKASEYKNLRPLFSTYFKAMEQLNKIILDGKEVSDNNLNYIVSDMPTAVDIPETKSSTNYLTVPKGYVYINHPINPSSALLENNDEGIFFLIGERSDSRFDDGVSAYIEQVGHEKKVKLIKE